MADGIDEIEIHEFNEETKCWSRLESFPFHGEKLDCFYVGGKLIVFDTPMDETDNLKNRVGAQPQVTSMHFPISIY